MENHETSQIFWQIIEMINVAFIDHSYKKLTNSSGFFVDRLKEDFAVKVFWDESWAGGPRVDLRHISEGSFDILILFQQMNCYTIEEMLSLKCSVILIPMYDADGSRPDLFWRKYRKFKFINFSKTLHMRLLNLGIESFYCQYFPTPLPELMCKKKQEFTELKGFFWQRRSEITWKGIRKLIGQAKFTKIHIHTATDPPGYKIVLPTREDYAHYGITTSDWFAAKAEYLKEVAECQVFFAPRLYEGIGMAFIEAMAMGKCVVAPNNPTMNEYIIDGYNGLLFSPEDLRPLDFSKIEEICSNAGQYIAEGFTLWPANLQQMIKFIAEPRRRKISPMPALRKRLKLLFK